MERGLVLGLSVGLSPWRVLVASGSARSEPRSDPGRDMALSSFFITYVPADINAQT